MGPWICTNITRLWRSDKINLVNIELSDHQLDENDIFHNVDFIWKKNADFFRLTKLRILNCELTTQSILTSGLIIFSFSKSISFYDDVVLRLLTQITPAYIGIFKEINLFETLCKNSLSNLI